MSRALITVDLELLQRVLTLSEELADDLVEELKARHSVGKGICAMTPSARRRYERDLQPVVQFGNALSEFECGAMWRKSPQEGGGTL